MDEKGESLGFGFGCGALLLPPLWLPRAQPLNMHVPGGKEAPSNRRLSFFLQLSLLLTIQQGAGPQC